MIGYQLKHIRNVAGLTQPQLAQIMGVKLCTVAQIEVGRQKNNLHAEKYAKVFNCDIDDIYALGINKKYGDSNKTVSEQAKELIISKIFTNHLHSKLNLK